MKKITATLSIFLGLQLACYAQDAKDAESKDIQSKTGTYGEEISADEALPVTAVLLTNPGEKGTEIKVKGKIKEVCQSMGCWLTLELPDDKSVRVTTDHRFLVPMDISGYYAVVKGTLTKKVTSIEDLKHYAEEAGKNEEYIKSINSPQEEFAIDAVGILVLQKEG